MNNTISNVFSGDDPISMLENSLARTLKPVMPNPDFVKKLGHRILNPPPITIERRTGYKAFIVFSFALFSGIFLIWLLIKVFRFFSGETKEA